MTLPDNLALVGIGGAGKELVFKALEQDWIIDYYSKQIEGENRSLRAYIIDTATAEYDDDIKRHNRIMKRVKEMGRVYHGAGGTVSLNVVCLTKVIAVNKPSDLTKKEVRDAVRGDGQVWWLEDPECGLEGQFKKLKQLDSGVDQDFKQGTYRRRALSKAVFYKAFSNGRDPLNFNVTGSKVAIVAGLGGGTGSGMLFDVARELGEGRGGARDSTLFAVLPTTNESDIEKTNAYVTLSELEYANLKGMSPFDHVILLPFEPTGFRGTMGSKEVEEFDDVFPYILTSSYALTENMRAGDKIDKYTGFILADGCILRYGMEELLEIKRRIEGTIKELNKAVGKEEIFRNALFNRLGNMKHLVGTRDITVASDSALYLSSRLNSVEIWNDHAFEILGFDTVKKVKDGITSWKEGGGKVPDDNDFKGLVEYIEVLESILQGINSRDIDPISIADQNLLSDLIRVITTIRTTGDQIEIISSMDINVPALSEMVAGNVPSPADERALRESINSGNNEIERLKQSRSEMEGELEGLETRKEEVGVDVERICNTLNPKLDTLWTMRERSKESIEDIKALDEKVTDFVNNAFAEDANIGAHSLGSFRKILGFKDIVKRIDNLSDLLPGTNDFDIKNFLNGVAAYNYYKKRHTNLQDRKRGWKEWLKTLIYGGGKRDERNITNAEIAMDEALQSIKADDDRWGIHITNDNVDISVANIISTMMEKKTNEAIGEIVDYISNQVGGETNNDIRSVLMKDWFSSSLEMVDNTNKYLKNKFLEKENYEEGKKSLKDAIVDIKAEIEKSKNRTELLIDVKELVDETRRTINETRGLWDTYRKNLEEVGKIDTMVGKIVSEEEPTYISKIEPDLAILAGVKEDPSLGSLFEDVPVAIRKREIDRIMGGATRLVTTNLLSRKYLGVEKVAIEYDNSERWNFRIGVLFASTLCEDLRNPIANNELDLIGVVTKELALSVPEDAHIEPYNVAGRWDVGLVLFALPAFFDNLRSVDGYKSAFDRRKRREDVVNILHHALLLEEGKIVYRKDKYGPVDAAKIAKREVDGENVADEILEKMFEVEPFWGDAQDETRKED